MAAAEFSDAQVDKYFESKGEVTPDVVIGEAAPAPEPPAAEAEKPAPVDAPEAPASVAEATPPVAPVVPEAPKMVNLGALHEERERRKALQAEVKLHQEKTAQLENRLNLLYQKMAGPEEKTVNFSDDPIEATRLKMEAIEKRINEQQNYLLQNQQQQQQQAQLQQFVQQYKESANAYKQENRQFNDAYDYLVEGRTQEYLAAGYKGPEISQLIHQDELSIAARAYQDGVNPAERIYQLAVARGYKAPITLPPVPSVAEKLQAVEKGVKASKSLSAASGKASRGQTTLDELANMSDEDFDKVDWKKAWK